MPTMQQMIERATFPIDIYTDISIEELAMLEPIGIVENMDMGVNVKYDITLFQHPKEKDSFIMVQNALRRVIITSRSKSWWYSYATINFF
jgi:hypothetical protein